MKKKIVGVIPARLGSNRLRHKNLRLINGKPLIYYSIQTLKDCKMFDEIYVNSESDLIGEVAKRYGVNFYQRKPELATAETLFDEFIYDFLKNKNCDILAFVNPTTPLVTSRQIDEMVRFYLDHDYDTLISVRDIRAHCVYQGKPVNFSMGGKHRNTQDVEPVQSFIFTVILWDARKFVEQYEKNGFGIYTGKVGYYPFSGFATVDIDYEEDFLLAQLILENKEKLENPRPLYDELLKSKAHS